MDNNVQVWKILGRISAETCLKTDYFGSKSPKIAKPGWLRPQTSVQIKWLEKMCKTLFSLKLLVDADAWQIWGQNETYILYFLFFPLPCLKTFPRHWARMAPLGSLTRILPGSTEKILRALELRRCFLKKISSLDLHLWFLGRKLVFSKKKSSLGVFSTNFTVTKSGSLGLSVYGPARPGNGVL